MLVERMFQDTLTKFRLSRVERKLKVLRVRQRDARQELKELEAQRNDGEIPPDEFRNRAEELREQKSSITQDISELRDRKQELESELIEA